MINLYKRNAQGKPLVWSIENKPGYLEIKYGLVGGTLHTETVKITAKNVIINGVLVTSEIAQIVRCKYCKHNNPRQRYEHRL